MRPYFLNVDLEIESASKLEALVSLECTRRHRGADAVIHGLCAIIESLPPAARCIWNTARRKEFNAGYELRASERMSCFTLRPDTLQRMAGLGATLGVTYYRGEPE